MAQLKSTSVTGNLAVTGNVVASQIIKNGSNDDKILLGGGGEKPLSDLTSAIQNVDDKAEAVKTAVNNHIDKTNNPHSVTKAQIGLENVDNTSDISKPVSTAQQAAIDEAKADILGEADYGQTVKTAYQKAVEANTAVNNLQGSGSASDSGDPSTLTVVNALSRANEALAEAQSKTTMSAVEGKGYATKTEAQGYANDAKAAANEAKTIANAVTTSVGNLTYATLPGANDIYYTNASGYSSLSIGKNSGNGIYSLWQGETKLTNIMPNSSNAGTGSSPTQITLPASSGTLARTNGDALSVTSLTISSLEDGTSSYDKILMASDAGLIGYRTKKEFIQDLDLSQVYNYKGTLSDVNALKLIQSARVGDVYFISSTSDSWACKVKVTAATGGDYETYWSNLGNNVDLSGYMTLDTTQTITGKKIFVAPSTGASTITSDVESLIITNSQSKIDTLGSYLSGIAFNHMWNWGVAANYNTSAHAWVGLRLVSISGAETSALVFATRSNTSIGERPIERMCIAPDGKVGIGTRTPTMPLEVNGALKADSFTSDSTVYMKLSNSNEISFKPNGTGGIIYFGYNDRLSADGNKIHTYIFGQHSGETNNAHLRGALSCGYLTLNGTTAGVKATFEYNTDDNCIDVIFN